jgi:DHA2 family multidrug resistance protein
LKGKQIGQGAAFTGMMRQLGGSFGVALVIVLLDRKTESHRINLVSHLNSYNPAVQNRIQAIQHSFMAKGSPANIALNQSYQSLNHAVMKQATVLAYMDAFLYLGIMFLICIPFVLMVKRNKAAKVSLSEAMH